jgi:uncharacterized phage protein (TIGR01671 family)
MREILFRGKEGRTGKWFYGSLLIAYTPNDEPYYTIAVDGDFYVRVIPESVGQYTGLKDCNGKKIFEGDIIKVDSHRTYKVKHNDKDAMFVLRDEDAVYWHFHIAIAEGERSEVIGNIFDNPELFKGDIQ